MNTRGMDGKGEEGNGVDRKGMDRKGSFYDQITHDKEARMSACTGYQELTFHIRGTVPLIVHNGLLSDPLEERSIAVKAAYKANQKQKTDATAIELGHMEFLGGLYVNETGAPCIPGEVFEAAIRTAAKATKEGKSVQTGLFCDGNFPIEYDGPKDPEKMWESRGDAATENVMSGRRFVDRRRVRVGQAAVMRVRPVFHQWKIVFAVNYDPEVLNKNTVIGFVETLGSRVGLCEMRPRYGRFEVLEVS